jgi:hypothetical protein
MCTQIHSYAHICDRQDILSKSTHSLDSMGVPHGMFVYIYMYLYRERARAREKESKSERERDRKSEREMYAVV